MAKRLAGGRPKNEVCSVCEPAGLRTLQTVDGERPHTVRVCTHHPTMWIRDTNAARIMLRLLKCLVAGKDPPEALRRPARRGGERAVPELDILQATADGLAEAAAMRMRLRQRIDSPAINREVIGCETPYDSHYYRNCATF